MHVLGIDAGGTKTVALLADADGRIVAEGRAGGANLQTDGELEVEKVLHAVIEQATRRPRHHARGGVPRHGRRRSRGRRPHHSRHHAAPRLSLEHADRQRRADRAGRGRRREPGVVVIAGTGSIAYGVSQRGVAARAGGWGPTLGDEGSGYWIGRRALAAVMRDADGRGPRTALTPLVLEHFSAAATRRRWSRRSTTSRRAAARSPSLGAGRRRRARRRRCGGRRDHDRRPPTSWRWPPRR